MGRLTKYKMVIIPLDENMNIIQSGWMTEDFFSEEDFFKRGYAYDYVKIKNDNDFNVMIPKVLIENSIIRIEKKIWED